MIQSGQQAAEAPVSPPPAVEAEPPSAGEPAQPQFPIPPGQGWRDDRTASPLPFFVGTIALVLFTWAWIETNYITHYLAPLREPPSRDELLRTKPVTAEILIYVMIGSTTAFLCQPHPWRALGLLPWAGLALWVMMIIGMAVGYSPQFGRPLFAFIAGILWYVPFATALRRLPYVPISSGLHRLYDWPAATVLGLVCIWLYSDTEYTMSIASLSRGLISRDQYAAAWRGITTRAWLLFLVATVSLLLVIYIFRREMLESLTELIFLPLYRFHVAGPGIGKFPGYGPVLVVANHSAFFDPLWVAKVLPRQITPMMTSVYFDKPGLRFLMKEIINTIRIQETPRRKESPPEIAEAVSRLDQGECLLLFPEGRMRNREDELIKHFGQGVWLILKERPETTVVPVWIEGGWGSVTSYRDGTPPLSHRGKWVDWNRRITVVLGEPVRLSDQTLAEHQQTRTYLMEAVLSLRQYLPKDGGFKSSIIKAFSGIKS